MVRFRVRTLLWLMLLCGIGIVVRPTLEELLYYWFPFMVSVTILAGTAIGWHVSAVDRLGQTRRFLRATLVTVCIVTATLAVGMIWVRYRASRAFIEPDWPQPWPYPDQALNQYARWLDARNPPKPGFIKLRGEYYTVHRHINWVVFPLVAIASLIFGLATPEFGRRVWRKLREFVINTMRRRRRLNRSEQCGSSLESETLE